MDGANADSDHSMTWEDFFGSTTDLTPTLIGIYDSLLQPAKSRSESSRLESAKDARNDPPVNERTHGTMTEETKDNVESKSPRDPSKIAGGVKLPIAAINKSSLYTMRTISEKNGASDKFDSVKRTVNETKVSSEFDNLSPNVKRMLSSASETTTLKFQKKTQNVVRSSARYKTNIPLVGATSKISQSGLEILPSVEVYDQPVKTFARSKSEDQEPTCLPPKLEFKLGEQITYDVPTNNRPAIYDVPSNKKNAFESLSLPYIDQSIELSISSNDREFDIKLSSKDNSPQKSDACPQGSPAKSTKELNTNSLHRKDFHKSESPKLKKSEQFPIVTSSTGNLKNLPEKEPRLNPPSVEVSRPLSMSSIASSSSTSSSGVQNKGVNSAYLASIESLDDHSDADMTSANGSNHFVNSAGVLNNTASEERNSEKLPDQQCVEEMSGLSQLERVCSEIVQTENVYVEDLRQVVEGYLHIWRQENTFSDDELTELFNNVEDIYSFNRSLCSELNSCRLDATCIARCFVNNTTGFSVYTSYCTGYPRTMERLAALASTPHSARAFRERQMALGHPLPLASYLLKPVQRILKYHLLLQNVVKQCASRDTEYALLKMTGIAQHIDDMKRRHEHAVRVQEIQSLLYGWNGPDLTTYGELCAEGTFRVFGAKAMRHAFLFDKMLLVTKNREDGILAYKSHIMCNNMMLVESIAGAALSFHVIPWDAPRAQLTLQARSPRHKREWTLLLKRVILENYNAVIPSHARQLVMELGQNKTDDDMLAEKSHNLITQASMRKQLSAPEYLEKRKLERERRKSFENGTRGRLKKTNRKYTMTNVRVDAQECDCAQVSAEKGTDYTCDTCYSDLCWECEAELSKDKPKEDKCGCKNDMTGEKCAECDKSLHYIDAGSAEHLERKSSCKCSDFKSSQESFGKEFSNALNKTRGYHSSDNIVGYTDPKCRDDSSDTNNSLTNVRNLPKTCLKCAKIKENIVVTDSADILRSRKSRCNDHEKHRLDVLRSKSKDDPQRSKLSKIGTWRRKSEPGLQQNTAALVSKKSLDNYIERNETRGNEKIEFECRNCGSNKISRKSKNTESVITSDPELDSKKGSGSKNSVEIKMYNTKNIPKKISKLKKNRAKGMRFGTDTTAKFYADLSTDVSTENILHISESNDSLNTEKRKDSNVLLTVPSNISKDEDMDEETYKKLIEKTDSFKKNELERVKYLNKQKVINEGSETEEKPVEEESKNEEIPVSSEETEEPLEQIISQLLMENREFQKLLKKQQQRNSAQRRHQRLLKTHSNPEQASVTNKLKSNYLRQSSQTLDFNNVDEKTDAIQQSVTEDSEEDHIYETLRVEKRRSNETNDGKLNDESDCKKPPPLPQPQSISENTRPIFESDYVYLSFDKLNKLRDGIYDVPIKPPEKVHQTHGSDYYVAMEKQGPPTDGDNENVYDNIVEVCRRKKETPNNLPGEYLPMSPDQQSPNTPEIWLSRQKEHFNVCRDRKSGSLPRSFQVVTSNQEDNNLSTFKCKPNSNSKTYLNRDGKVMSTDRPFTIASDKGEISYDDVESYMSEGDILKFNKSKTENDYGQNISQSTLELEEEIDRCYKNNFEKISLDANKNESSLNISQPNLNTSMTSSCEVLPTESEEKSKDNEVIHPEHKIYKPTSNVLSLKNVLSRFKHRTSNKSCDEAEINANEQSSPDCGKSDLKSPTGDKKSALNPRNYSKNLLQRFRSIIGDEHSDDNQNKTSKIDDTPVNIVKSNIKLVITTTDNSPTTSTIAYSSNNDNLSRSVCEQTTLSDSQNEKNNLEVLSHSCDNITQRKQETLRPTYEKSVSLTTNVATSCGNTSSPSRSNNSSYQSLNKLPIYMQGSKHLGARIAQSDYLDPTTLMSDKSSLKNINVLINKNAVRPDSLFSNSSFVTSSSEGTYLESQNKTNHTTDDKEADSVKFKASQLEGNSNPDESYYERSFEKIEEVTDKDVFRDSAVYSDQEDADESNINKSKNITRVQSVKRNVSIRTQKMTVISSGSEKSSTQSRVAVTSRNKIMEKEEREQRSQSKPKVAPPVPAKPRMSNIPSSTTFQTRQINKSTVKTQEQPLSLDCNSTKSIRHGGVTKTESKPSDDKPKSQAEGNKSTKKEENSACGIQLKRMSFERASLDSATRKFKTPSEKRLSIDPPKSKSVLERRMEIEQMSRNLTKTQIPKKPVVQSTKPKLVTTKVATFERSLSNVSKESAEVRREEDRAIKKGCAKESSVPSNSTERDENIPTNKSSISEKSESEVDLKSSWVKQVVNKFQ